MSEKLQVYVSTIINDEEFQEELAYIKDIVIKEGHNPVTYIDKILGVPYNKHFCNIDFYICVLNHDILMRLFYDIHYLFIYNEMHLIHKLNIPIYFMITDVKDKKYNNFNVPTIDNEIMKIVNNKSELKNVISSFIKSFIYHRNNSDNKSALDIFNALYKANLNEAITYIDSYRYLTQINHYYSIYQNFEMESITNICANKCIIDPLGNPISDITNIKIDVSEVNDWMLNELNKNPTDLYKLSSRRFEELIAEIFIRKGYNVELTSATRDGGKDIYAAFKNDFGSFLYVVECKKYKPTYKVGVSVLRDLYGVLSKEKATYGIAVTTSYFSKPAQEFQKDIQYQMSLQDFNSIQKWLCDVT